MNRIDKLNFDFRMEQTGTAHTLYGRWDSFYSMYIERTLQEVLQNADTSSLTIRIEQIELDLGTIPEEKLETYFSLLLKEKLEEKLYPFLLDYSVTEAGNSEDKTTGWFEIVCRFLLHGVLPWDIENKYRNFSFLFLMVLKADAVKLKLFLFNYGHYTGLCQRLVMHLNDPELEKGIHLIAPAESSFICSYIHLLRLKYKELQHTLIRESDYHKVSWQIVYTYLLNRKSSWFNRKSFLQVTIYKLAASYNLTYEYLLSVLTNQLENWLYRHSIPVGLLFLLNQLREENAQKQWQLTGFQQKKLYQIISTEKAFRVFNTKQDKLYQSLLKILSGEDTCRQFLLPLPDESIYRLVYTIQPKESSFIVDYARSLEQQKEKGVLQGKAGGEFRLLKWQIILPLLIASKESSFNRVYFIRKVLSRIASHYNLTIYEVLEYICREFAHWKYTSSLQEVLQFLWRECKDDKKLLSGINSVKKNGLNSGRKSNENRE
ncbi:MAG: hypothetical protein LIP01_14330 [Tannerellaceae bacterium]|nr:hypothetical protein [Tannerellaceae bacterium]